MKYPVIKRFKDKTSGKLYKKGGTYEADKTRGEYLRKRGFLGKAAPEPKVEVALDPRIKKLNGGYYLVPDGSGDGSKVRGKDNAIAALAAYDEAVADDAEPEDPGATPNEGDED